MLKEAMQDKRDRRFAEDKRGNRLVVMLTDDELDELNWISFKDIRGRAEIVRSGIFAEIKRIKQKNPGLRRG